MQLRPISQETSSFTTGRNLDERELVKIARVLKVEITDLVEEEPD
jgi:hypothetical protein